MNYAGSTKHFSEKKPILPSFGTYRLAGEMDINQKINQISV